MQWFPCKAGPGADLKKKSAPISADLKKNRRRFKLISASWLLLIGVSCSLAASQHLVYLHQHSGNFALFHHYATSPLPRLLPLLLQHHMETMAIDAVG